MNGNTGKIAAVDLGSGTVETITYPEVIYRKFIGGSGLAARIFWDRADFSARPLAPESLLIFMNGPLAGVKLSGASRMSAAARSPLTGGFADTSCGGHFPPALKFAGFDGLVIRGKARLPSILKIVDATVTIEEAGDLWGRGIYETNAMLEAAYGKRSTSLAIGPAGETMVPFACILNKAHHAFGRCGLGAVMGSKLLKAIVVAGTDAGKIAVADERRLQALIKEVTPRIRESIISQVLHDFGSAGNLEGHMYNGDVPIRNWTSNFNEEMAESLTGSTLTDKYLTAKGTCAYCAVACKRIVQVAEGPFAIPRSPGPEYETVAAFGALLGSSDLAAVCKANYLCNDFGMDTISAGSTIAWAMEAWEKGHLTTEHTGGIGLKWADMDTVVNLILPMMALRKGKLGRLLSRGCAAAARELGNEALNYTAQSKGLEAPMHDPRGGGHGHAIAYAVSPRGACHVATAMHFMETGACHYPEIGFEFDLEALTHEKKSETMMLATAIGMIENSVCLCQYADRSLTITDMVALINWTAGYDYSVASMMEAGMRVFHLKRCINHRFGFIASDDALTPRMLEPARDGEPEGIAIRFDEMKERFYELMKIDPVRGIAYNGKLLSLGLSEEAELLWGASDQDFRKVE
jgi:aldehyde:ferredoxin oxidoreductase